MRGLLSKIAALMAMSAGAFAAEPAAANYGEKTKFAVSRPMKFPAFELTYDGKHRVVPPQYPRGWWAHDFTVHAGEKSQKVVWSAGTGDIGPARFTVSGRVFALELELSDKLGKLRADELVVSVVERP